MSSNKNYATRQELNLWESAPVQWITSILKQRSNYDIENCIRKSGKHLTTIC